MLKIKKIIEKNPKKLKRVLIFSLLALFLVAFIFLPNVAFADWANLYGNDAYVKWISDVISVISHVVYVFIWPCLAIAGAALDNSLIYWSFLHLDVALWNIWNIMKNFANFTLWFIFVFTIVKNLFAWSFGWSGGDPIKWARDTVVKTLIAWVLVQMSRFIVSALIDLSTILIYAVWGIPLSMLWSYDHNVSDMPIMKLNTVFDKNNISYYYSYWWHNYSPCLLANKNWDSKEKLTLQWLSWEYVAWRQYLYMSSWFRFESWYCVLNWYLYKYEESTWFFGGYYQETWDATYVQKNTSYLSQIKNYWTNLTWKLLEERDACSLVRAYNKEYTWNANETCVQICSWYWEISYTEDVFSGADGFTLKQLMEDSKWWVWPFITMYSSILRYQDLVINPGSDSLVWNLFGLVINTFFAFVLFVPIAILMVLLIIRVWYLWIVVAISPILILINFGPIWDNIKKNDIFKKFGPKEIIINIFSPVIVVFAVSLCIVFLSTIFASRPNEDNASTTLSAFGVEKVEQTADTSDSGDGWNGQGSCIMPNWNGSEWWKNVSSETYSILWLVDINLNVQNYNHGKDMFVWVLLELLATWIVRFFMKFAIWMMWKTWENLMKSAEKLITNYPLITLPTWWKVGLGAFGIWEDNGGKLSNLINNKIDDIVNLREQNEVLNKFFNLEENSTEGEKSVTEVIKYIRGNPNVTYENLWAERQKVLESVYWTADEAKAKFDDLKTYINTTNTTISAEDMAKLMWTWIIDAGKSLPLSPDKSKTNADALNFTQAQLDIAVRSDPNWIAWARGMIWGSVHTMDGVFIVDVVKWTEPNNPQYKIVTREEYEQAHFGNQTIDTINKATYDKNKVEIDKYLRELKEELDKLTELQNKQNRSVSEDKLLEQLQDLKKELTGKNLIDEVKTQLGINNNNG